MDKNVKIFVIALAALVVLCPLGLLAVGTAYGEWGPDDIKDMVGYVPAGLQHMSGIWSAPLDGYDLPGDHTTVPEQAPGYYVSAIVGVLLCAGVLYGVGKVIAKQD